MTSKIGQGDHLVDQVLGYKGITSKPYIETYTKDWIVQIIEEKDQILLVEKNFEPYEQNGADLIDFTRVFLNMLSHEEDQTLYITIALVDLFRDICETFSLKHAVRANDILNYLVENLISRDLKSQHIIPTKKLPEPRKFCKEPSEIRDIDINAPIIYGPSEHEIKRIKCDKMISDSSHHTTAIKRVCFAEKPRKILTLEPLKEYISMYDLNCVLERKIYPKNFGQKGETGVIDFAWSEKHERLGAILKDFTMSFWDLNDNFEFEKNFSFVNFVPDYQLDMWCIEFMNLWITTDKTNKINMWDIEKETMIGQISSPKIRSSILDIIVFEVLKLVGVSTLDRKITVWDFQKKICLIELDVSQNGAHTIKWASNYHILATAGFENNINLWGIDPAHKDVSLKGQLVGHTSMVTAVQHIDKTPMIISADDQGNVRIWDIRTLKCVQTAALGIRVPINEIIDMYKFGKLCFVGMRINLVEFEEPTDSKKIEEHVWPIFADYNLNTNDIVVCTRKDMRIIEAGTGRTKRIYAGLLKNQEDEISICKLTQQNKKFILGSEKGQVNLYSYATGELIKSFESHTNEVVSIKVDYANNLTITAGWDANLYIQKETLVGHEVRRSIKNLHFKKEVIHLEVSVHHNLVITATRNNVLYVWDYEYGKLVASLEIEEHLEPTFLYIISGHSCLILGDTGGKITFLSFKRKDLDVVAFQKIGLIDLNSTLNKPQAVFKPASTFANKIALETQYSGKPEALKSCTLYLATNKGNVQAYDILPLIKSNFLGLIPHANKKSNYNAERINHEDFYSAIKNYKFALFNIRYSKEKDREDNCTILNDKLIKEFNTHKEALTTLTILEEPTKKLLTSSLDNYIKIWTLEGDLVASLNINHPLPIQWELESKNTSSYKRKILYALKVIETILKKYKRHIYLPEAKKISVNSFIKDLNAAAVFMKQRSKIVSLRQGEEQSKNKGEKVMADAYSPRDLQFDKAKDLYQRELQGPSLRHMEVAKRFDKTASSPFRGKLKREIQLSEKLEECGRIDHDRDRNDFMTMLIGDNRENLLKDINQSPQTRVLAVKLDGLKSLEVREIQKVYPMNRVRRSFVFITNLGRNGSVPSPSTEPASSLIKDWREAVEGSSSNLSTDKVNMTNAKRNKKVVKLRSRMEVSSNDSIGKSQSQVSNIFLNKTPSIVSTDVRSQSVAKIDFFSYAQEKLASLGETKYTTNTNNTLDQSTSGGTRSTEYDRRLQNKKLGQILNKLDRNLKKAQTPAYFMKSKYHDITGDSALLGSQMLTGKNLEESRISFKQEKGETEVIHVESQLQSPIAKYLKVKLPTDNRITRGKKILNDMKKAIEDSLGMTMDGPEGRGSRTTVGFHSAMMSQSMLVENKKPIQLVKKRTFESLEKLFKSNKIGPKLSPSQRATLDKLEPL